jgi:hypothetical protein
MNRTTKQFFLLCVPAALASLSACESIMEGAFDTVVAIDNIGSYSYDEVLVAEERPQAIGKSLVTTVRVKGELTRTARDRDARALGEIIIRGDQWGYSAADRITAVDTLIEAVQSIAAESKLQPGDGSIPEPARELTRITLGAISHCNVDEIESHFYDHLAKLPPGRVSEAFKSETPNRWFFGID